jgi:Phosphatidylglycerophosphate synthase
MAMKKYLAVLPNLLTILRFLLSVQFLWMLAELFQHGGTHVSVLPFILLFFIYLTDFLDGRLARALKAESSVGSILDVSADGFFIASSLIFFNFYNLLPVWFTLVVILDFCGFLLTSKLLAHTGRAKKSMLVFDKIGRVAAVLFHSIPVLTCIALIDHHLTPYLLLLLYLSTVLALLSFIARCAACYCSHTKNPTVRQNVMEEN